MWELWTTSEGIESWWAADGFDVKVRKLDLRPGRELVYATTAITPEQIHGGSGHAAQHEVTQDLTELVLQTRIAYTSPADFSPAVNP